MWEYLALGSVDEVGAFLVNSWLQKGWYLWDCFLGAGVSCGILRWV